MKRFLILFGASTLTAALYLISRPSQQHEPETGVMTRLARWGRRERFSATGGKLKGGLEYGLGKLTGSSAISGKGIFDAATAVVKDTAGKLAESIAAPPHIQGASSSGPSERKVEQASEPKAS